MNAPDSVRGLEDEDAAVREYDYGDEQLVVIDFGAGASEAAIDVVGDTAIVVLGDEQYEIDLPATATEASANNGVLTIVA